MTNPPTLEKPGDALMARTQAARPAPVPPAIDVIAHLVWIIRLGLDLCEHDCLACQRAEMTWLDVAERASVESIHAADARADELALTGFGPHLRVVKS